MNVQRKEKGFTIIEVVLVLAIAGLIFLMVFIALPALQRSQRDTQRKNDLSRVQTAVTSYTSSNRGSLPANTTAAWQTFLTQYLTPTSSDTFLDPLGANSTQGTNQTTYVFTSTTTGLTTGTFDPATTQNVIYFAEGYTCGDQGAITKAGTRTVALLMYLEGGGTTCVNT